MRTEQLIVALGIGAVLLSTAASVGAQGQRGAGPARPWPPQRLSDGQPDVQGIWAAANGGLASPAKSNSRGGGPLTRGAGRGPRPPARQTPPPPATAPPSPAA